ncbi:hypothetical protein BJF86_07875 [Serinicoccus sp. CNJ-927]|uniref:trypsin-like serine peptidase n=1 Tax=Serinicoccus sp. CNJ-927 TaxID=1904970 RepID=UPI000962FD09|nr:hypothetical protein [Serinicoccus sp. CNJ-927]OLT39360.1 hypothetical protein BJF86_07875 [Serinicoccus sp. CNJ-927]
MRPVRTKALTLAGAAALALSVIGASGAGAAPDTGSGDDEVVVKHSLAPTLASQDSVRQYWTPERMENAQPRDLGTSGKRTSLPSTQAAPSAAAQAVRVTPQARLGKVFFTLGGQDYVCSGTSTRSANRDVVTTAGHCLNEGPGDFATNFTYVPAYNNGQAPYGQWVADNLYAASAWVNRGDINQDVAFAVMAEKNGQSLTDATGDYPIGFNLGYNRSFQAYGYPADTPYNGAYLYRCSGTSGRDSYGTNDHRLPCSMTGGSSGGGWITNGTLNSVNSFGYGFEQDVMYGPYFGSTAQQVYNAAQND